MKKWNPELHRYEPYKVPEGALLYTDDMDEECACASCGKKMLYGDSYSSREIHSDHGFGYCICKECMNAEIDRARKSREGE